MQKRLLFLSLLSLGLSVQVLLAQRGGDKSSRPSPPAQATATLASGAKISIDYSRPSLKGRTIGKNVEPMIGKVWRAGANEATVFETSKNIKVNGQALPAGKYAFFVLPADNEWTLIFNKTWDQWGAFGYKASDDVLKVKVKPGTNTASVEQLQYEAANNGKISLTWGTLRLDFQVE